jgi:chromosome segregation ATPase
MAVLSREHLKLKEAYRQHRDRAVSLESQSHEGWEWRARCATIQREREGQVKRLHGLEQSMGICQARLKELKEEGAQKQKKIERLQNLLEEERERNWCKTKVEREEEKWEEGG